MKLCTMNKLESNSSICDETISNSTSTNANITTNSTSKVETATTTTTTISTTQLTNLNYSPNYSDCDEMSTSTSSPCSSSLSPPASPIDADDDDDIMMSNNCTSNCNIINTDTAYNSCSHCAKSLSTPAVATTTTTSSSSMNTSTSGPLSDLSNKRLFTAREIVSVIRKGKFDEFINLLHSKPNVDLNTFVNGNTALHYCLLFGRDISWCKQLVSKGANPNLSNIDGWHPIHLAAYGHHHDILAYLLRCNSRQIV